LQRHRKQAADAAKIYRRPVQGIAGTISSPIRHIGNMRKRSTSAKTPDAGIRTRVDRSA